MFTSGKDANGRAPANQQTTYDYHRSTLDADVWLAELNREIRGYCSEHPVTGEEDKQALLSVLLRRAGIAAFQGASRLEGGPFGALVADFNTPDHIPVIVGFGTNHVVPNNDPSAHAEVTAIRDTAKRLGRTDLSGLTLVTSCECCPMCLSAATGSKLDKIYFSATRNHAADAGFTDADQYRLMREGGIELHARKTNDDAALKGHDAAVIVRHQGQAYTYYGDYKTAAPGDPTDIPCVQAIKKACASLAALTGKNEFHLPEDTQLISRDMPHPLSLVAADWARIGRRRGSDPRDPLQDSPDKDTSRILYVNNAVEQMTVAKDGATNQVDTDAIWEEIENPTAVQVDKHLGRAREVAFDEWKRLVRTGFMPRY